MPYNAWWLCFPTLWKELCPGQSHLLAPEGLTPMQCPFSLLFFLRKFHFTGHHQMSSWSIKAAYQSQLSLGQAQSQYKHHTLLVHFLTLTPTAREKTFCYKAGIVSNPTRSGQSQVTLFTTHCALTSYLFQSHISILSTMPDKKLLSKLLHG